VPRKSAFWAETQVLHLFYVPKVSEMLRNTPKHHFWSNIVEWMVRNCDPEIVHSSQKHEFFIFLGPKVSEMLRNTPKHNFWSNIVEWMVRNCYPEIVHSGRKHEFFIFLGPKVSEMV
jgi:hypothetical protein